VTSWEHQLWIFEICTFKKTAKYTIHWLQLFLASLNHLEIELAKGYWILRLNKNGFVYLAVIGSASSPVKNYDIYIKLLTRTCETSRGKVSTTSPLFKTYSENKPVCRKLYWENNWPNAGSHPSGGMMRWKTVALLLKLQAQSKNILNKKVKLNFWKVQKQINTQTKRLNKNGFVCLGIIGSPTPPVKNDDIYIKLLTRTCESSGG